jgi:hypothetical protein
MPLKTLLATFGQPDFALLWFDLGDSKKRAGTRDSGPRSVSVT